MSGEVLEGEIVYESDGLPAVVLDERGEAMRNFGICWCPPWCAQDPLEHQYEQHWPDEWSSVELMDGQFRASARPRSDWHYGAAASHNTAVEFKLEKLVDDGYDNSVWLDAESLAALRGLLDTAEEQLDWEGDGNWKEAYPGGQADWEADQGQRGDG